MESPLRKRSLKRVTEGSHWRESQQVLFRMISVLRLDAALLVPVYEELIRNRESLRNGTQTKITTSVQFSSSVVSASVWPHESQHARSSCASLTPGVQPNPCPSSQWYHRTISSSVVPFSRPQSFPASGSFQMSSFFASGGQNIGASATASVLPVNIQDRFPLGQTSWISRVSSNTTVQKQQFFGAQLS